MYSEIKPKFRQIKNGLYVITTQEIINGDIIIPKGTNGKIVSAQNQVSADIWFYDKWKYKKCLNVDTDVFKPSQFRGVVLTVKASVFAINYKHDEHSEMRFNATQLQDIPYLTLDKIESYEGRLYVDNKKIREYILIDIIDSIEEGFSEFTKDLEHRPTTEDDCFDLDFVFTDSALEKFYIEKNKISEAFMKATGINYNFLGGTIEL